MSRRDQQDEKTMADRRRTAVPKAARRAARRRADLEARLRSAEQLVAKRTKQLALASAKEVSLRSRLTELADPAESPEVTGAAGPRGYCIKDRRQVAIADPRAVVLANGRHAIAGTCPDCGSRLVRLGVM
jgi:Domain of unknown function (DUF5679)